MLAEAEKQIQKYESERSIKALAKSMLELPGVVIGDFEGNEEFPVFHHFANGVYCRETHLPAGSVVVGKKHRYETNNILVTGKIGTINPGVPDEVREAPSVWQSPPGTKRAVATIEDAIWITTHPIPKEWGIDDLDKIEEYISIKEDIAMLENLE